MGSKQWAVDSGQFDGMIIIASSEILILEKKDLNRVGSKQWQWQFDGMIIIASSEILILEKKI
ncbi:MAG: hypothetical protein IPH42_12355 [Bacteroidetes bacterium]|nr:hypothetical protein [Bacteroidota bacterium]